MLGLEGYVGLLRENSSAVVEMVARLCDGDVDVCVCLRVSDEVVVS